MGERLLLTIGHSNHAWPAFLSLLTQHGVTAVADVRSTPYSRFNPHFRREPLAQSLKEQGIDYVYLGKELGARRTERESYRNGQARHDLIAQLPAFRDGLDRVRKGMLSRRIALLCAEKDPITCHRMVLVCRHLRHAPTEGHPIEIAHILGDGTLESTSDAETRLRDLMGLPNSLFSDQQDLIEQAYDAQSERIAFTE
jgi:uncharacterized protein (DUF488 family)